MIYTCDDLKLVTDDQYKDMKIPIGLSNRIKAILKAQPKTDQT